VAYYVGETITFTISHIFNSTPVTGATFTVSAALDPLGSSFSPTIDEIGGGVYQGTFTPDSAGQWYLLLVDTALTPDVYYEQEWDVDAVGSGASTVATSGVSLARLRRDVGDQIGDVLVCEATSASGSTSQFIDVVNLIHGTNTLAGRQCVLTTGLTANTGTVRLITGNTPSTGSIEVRPEFFSPPSSGNILEIYSTDAGGPGIREIDRAINRAIRDAGPANLVEVVATAVEFDAEAPTFTIPDEWYGFIGVEYEHRSANDTWPEVPWRELDRIGRTVVIGRGGMDYFWLDGQDVRLRGYVLPGELSLDTDETAIDPAWLINQASYHALLRSAKKRTPTQANLALGEAQAWREEALRTQGLARPRLKTYYRLGAV
jgi:hypothetical protein